MYPRRLIFSYHFFSFGTSAFGSSFFLSSFFSSFPFSSGLPAFSSFGWSAGGSDGGASGSTGAGVWAWATAATASVSTAHQKLRSFAEGMAAPFRVRTGMGEGSAIRPREGEGILPVAPPTG